MPPDVARCVRLRFAAHDEAAAFVAALTRQIDAAGNDASTLAAAWLDRHSGADLFDVYLNLAALELAERRFSPLPLGARVWQPVPRGASLVIGPDAPRLTSARVAESLLPGS